MVSANRSAGLLMFRRRSGVVDVFLVHPGGPFFTGKDLGVWSIPKGEIEPGEDLLEVARREFGEETGQSVAALARSPLVPVGSVRQSGGKTVEAWAFEGDWPEGLALQSNTFAMEWPPRSGRTREFPEIDRGEFFPVAVAKEKINPAQAKFIDRLLQHLHAGAR